MMKREPKPCVNCGHDVFCHLSTTWTKRVVECGCGLRSKRPCPPICDKAVTATRAEIITEGKR